VTRNYRAKKYARAHYQSLSMTQLIIGTALGFFVAQGVLYSIRHSLAGFSAANARKADSQADPSLGSAFISAFINTQHR